MSRKRVHPAQPPLQPLIEDVQPLAETIWSNLASVQGDGEQTRILFTSAEDGAGTTLICAASALGLARNTRRPVTVVEANLQRPALARYLGTPPAPGLSDLLVGQASLVDCKHAVPGCPGLTVVSGGSPRHVIAGEFAAQGARELLEAIASDGRYVLFDAPPPLERSETRALFSLVDGVVLVLRARSSRKDAARRTVELCEGAGVEVLGSVLNRFRSDLPFAAP